VKGRCPGPLDEGRNATAPKPYLLSMILSENRYPLFGIMLKAREI
jgi:hypothetical protein